MNIAGIFWIIVMIGYFACEILGLVRQVKAQRQRRRDCLARLEEAEAKAVSAMIEAQRHLAKRVNS